MLLLLQLLLLVKVSNVYMTRDEEGRRMNSVDCFERREKKENLFVGQNGRGAR